MGRVFVNGFSIITGGRYYDKGLNDLFADAFLKAWDNAGNPEIDMVYIASAFSELIGEQLISSSYMCEFVGLEDTPSVRIEMGDGSSSHALLEAYKAIHSGYCSTIAVVGVEKVHDVVSTRLNKFMGMLCNSDYEYFFGITPLAISALIMREYMVKYEYSYEELAEWVVKMHDRGSRNSLAFMRKRITINDILNSEIIADPLRLYDIAPPVDGTGAIIMSNKPLKINAIIEVAAVCSGSNNTPINDKNDLTELKSVIKARDNAFKMADISIDDVDAVEVHDNYSILGILAVEALGFAKKGETPKLISEGVFEPGGNVVINASGGLKCMGFTVGASGMYQLVTMLMEIMGEKPLSIGEVNYGIVQDMAGIDRSSVITILKRVS